MPGLLGTCSMNKIAGVSVCIIAAVLFFFAPAARSADTDIKIDRDRLIFFLNDSLAVHDYSDELDQLFSDLYGASSWLDDAAYSNVNAGEAIVNARRVVETINRQAPGLAARIEGFPRTGPSFPPIFYWFEDWHEWQRVALDAMAVNASHLADQIDAMNARDPDRVLRVQDARGKDQAAFDIYFAEIDRQVIETLPEDHPTRLLLQADQAFRALADKNLQRNLATDEALREQMTLDLARAYSDAADQTVAMLRQFEMSIDPFGADLRPLVKVLTRDEAEAERVTAQVLKVFHQANQDASGLVEAVREYARLELLFYRDGPSPELFEGFTRAGQNIDAFYAMRSAAFRKQTEILIAAIAE